MAKTASKTSASKTAAAKPGPPRRATKRVTQHIAKHATQTAKTDGTLLAAAKQIKSWADTAIGVASPATELALTLVRAGVGSRGKNNGQIAKAGAMLKRMRETAGLTASDLAQAINLQDPALIEQAEGGKLALPFELILRVAAVLGRNDPVPALMRLTRAYHPELWKTLESLGLGRLMVQAGRERELANLMRANDAARQLSDADFAEVLGFTKRAFEMAVAFRGR